MLATPSLVDVPARGTQVVNVEIQVGKERYAAVAEGMVARRLANTLAGTCLMAEGELHAKHWKTADGKRHQQLEIHLIRVTG